MKNRKNIIFVTSLLLVLLLNSCAFLFELLPRNGGSDDGSSNSGGASEFAKAMLAEVNFARTQPAEYAEQRLKSAFNSGEDNGAYNDIKSRSSVGALKLQSQLCSAAQKYAKYMADHNVFDHNADGTPSSRCKAEGYKYYAAENLAAGGFPEYNAKDDAEKAAKAVVRDLIIDEGVSSLGHRNNIMNGTHKKLGVGFYRNTGSKYKNYVVQDFGSF